MRLYLEYHDDSSSKFWEIEQTGATHTIRYGKTGALGTQKTKTFPTEEAAQKDAQRLIKSKQSKGYVEAEPPAGAEETDRGIAKREKVKAIAEAGIGAVIPPLLKGTGYAYSLQEGSKSSALRVRIDDRRFIEVNLPHATFMKRSEKLLLTIAVAKAMAEDLPYLTALGRKPFSWDWGSYHPAKWEEFAMIFSKEVFLERLAMEYCERTLLAHGFEPSASTMDYQDIVQLDFPGLERRQWECSGIEQAVNYAIEGAEGLLKLRQDWVAKESYIHGGVNIDILEFKGKIPAREGWIAFLEGFAEFHSTLQPAWDSYCTEEEQRDEVRMATLKEQLAPSGCNYSFELHDLRHDKQLVLHVEMKPGKVITMLYSYPEFDQEAQNIGANVERVRKAMGESPLQFKIIDVATDRTKYGSMVWKIEE